MRSQFKFKREYFEAIKDLPDDIRLQMCDAIMSYALDGEEPSTIFSGVAQLVWSSIKKSLSFGLSRYSNGKKGGAPKGHPNWFHGRKLTEVNRELTESLPKVNLHVADNEKVVGEHNSSIVNRELTESLPKVNLHVADNEEVKQKDNLGVQVVDNERVTKNSNVEIKLTEKEINKERKEGFPQTPFIEKEINKEKEKDFPAKTMNIISSYNSKTNECACVREEDLVSDMTNSPIWQEDVMRAYKITQAEVLTYISQFSDECKAKMKTHYSEADIKRHFCEWLKYKTNGNNRTDYKTAREKFDADLASACADFVRGKG